MVKHTGVVFSAGFAGLIFSSVLLAGDADKSPNALPRQAVVTFTKHFPDMRPVQTKDVNATSCKLQMRSEMGPVAEDFNGDGIKDYAVLLISTTVKRTVKWEAKNWPVHDVVLVVLEGQKDNTFRFQKLYAQEDSLPTIYNIRFQHKGELREVGTGKIIKMTAHGFMLSACEKFAVVYFFDNEQYRMVGIEG